eukprot:11285038-Alexandrium_andersonii.AAC.1
MEGGEGATVQGVACSGGHPTCAEVRGAGTSVNADRRQDPGGVALGRPALQAPCPGLQLGSVPLQLVVFRVHEAEGPVGRPRRAMES